MQQWQATPVWTGGAALGEGPLWHAAENRLYWVDIENKALHIFDPASGTDAVYETPGRIGVVAFTKDGRLLGAVEDTLYFMQVENGALALTPFVRIAEVRAKERFNDGECDPAGRFLVGSITGKEQGYLFSVTPDGQYTMLLEGVTCSNGIGFSPDQRTMYYIDTPVMAVVAYDYDLATGDISGKRIVRRFAPDEGMPDGMTVDRAGNLWVAHWGGSCVTCCTPGGEVRGRIAVPASRVTSAAFGGAALDTLFITTASAGLKASERECQPLAGGLFKAQVDAVGLEPYRFG